MKRRANKAINAPTTVQTMLTQSQTPREGKRVQLNTIKAVPILPALREAFLPGKFSGAKSAHKLRIDGEVHDFQVQDLFDRVF